jgi:hypothetical protein
VEEPKSLKFKVVAGKPTPKEVLLAAADGFLEAYRVSVPGGAEVIMAKSRTGLINGKKNRVFLLPEKPPESVIMSHFIPIETVMTTGKEGETIPGLYGLADGRKFFVPGASHPKSRAKKPQA